MYDVAYGLAIERLLFWKHLRQHKCATCNTDFVDGEFPDLHRTLDDIIIDVILKMYKIIICSKF